MKQHCFGCQHRIRFFQRFKYLMAEGELRPFHWLCGVTWFRSRVGFATMPRPARFADRATELDIVNGLPRRMQV